MVKNVELNFEVTPLTYAVLSQELEAGELATYVLDEKQEYIIPTTPTKIIEQACRYYGSSLKGRVEGTKEVSEICYKPPIAINPSNGMFFFPTSSPRLKTCSWIAHSHILTLHPKEDQRTTEIIFKNGRKVIVLVTNVSITNQLQRSAQLRYELENLLYSEKLESYYMKYFSLLSQHKKKCK